LSAINLAVGAIKKYWAKMEPDMIVKKLYKIEDQVLHMTKLLDNILIFEQAEESEVRQNPTFINFEKFMNEITEEVYSSFNITHKIILIGADQLKSTDVFIDKKLGRNIFIKILSNAIKYSPYS
jgi:K+-sensing histidine kinase KdpD